MYIISFLRPFQATRMINGEFVLPSSGGRKVEFAFGIRDVEISEGQQAVVTRSGMKLLMVGDRPEHGDVVLDSAEEGVDFEVLRTAVLGN